MNKVRSEERNNYNINLNDLSDEEDGLEEELIEKRTPYLSASLPFKTLLFFHHF